MIRLFCSLLLALLCVSAHASFSASVDRARLTEGESVELTLESDDPTLFGKPDLSPLDALFEVLGTRQVNRLATQNGRAQATTRWIVTLLPKQSGYVAIPPISLGASSTQPIRLHVLEARDRAKSSKLAPVFIDASVDQEKVYVQAQAILTLRIYHSVSLYDDS
ncbi:BatD family protein, partial [Pseudomonas aeruginosa]